MNKIFVVIIAAILASLMFLGIVSCVEARTEKPTEVITYTVKPGDTLWDISEEYKPAGTDKREYIYDIRQLNGLETSDIYPGMVLEIETEVK